jgi:hypothetical protein
MTLVICKFTCKLLAHIMVHFGNLHVTACKFVLSSQPKQQLATSLLTHFVLHFVCVKKHKNVSEKWFKTFFDSKNTFKIPKRCKINFEKRLFDFKIVFEDIWKLGHSVQTLWKTIIFFEIFEKFGKLSRLVRSV